MTGTPEQSTRFRYPEKVSPGRYEVSAWVGSEHVIARFKSERDAHRFFSAVERGKVIFR